MSADGVQSISSEVAALRSALDYLESRLSEVTGTISGVTNSGRGQTYERLQQSGIRSGLSQNAHEAHDSLRNAMHYVEASTRYVETWIGDILNLIELRG